MIANLLGGDGLIVLIIALVVLFGGSQLPKLARNVGAAGKEFRKAQAEADHDQAAHDQAAHDQAAQDPQPPATPAQLAAAPPPVASAPASQDDKLAISRSELREELAHLLDERRDPGN
jgi:sec-independent protein translocase protein TatA